MRPRLSCQPRLICSGFAPFLTSKSVPQSAKPPQVRRQWILACDWGRHVFSIVFILVRSEAIRPPYFSGCIWAIGFSFMIAPWSMSWRLIRIPCLSALMLPRLIGEGGMGLFGLKMSLESIDRPMMPMMRTGSVES